MLKNKWLKLDIQYFAEEPPGDELPPEDITLSQADLDKKIEAEADRKLASALEKKQAEWDAQLTKKLEEERTNAEEYAKLSEKEKKDAEYQKRVDDLEKREKELNNRQLLSQIEADLKENDLPVSLSLSLLSIGDNEKIKESITGIKKDFDEAVNLKVKEALRQETPGKGGSASTIKNPFKAESFNLTEQGRLLKENPELYKQLQAQA